MSEPSPPPSSEAFAELLSLAVHEFRTPASVVGGYLRMLQRDTDNPLTERQAKLVGDAEKAFSKMVALVTELSDLGKLDDGRLALQQAPLDLFAIVETVATSTTEAADRGVTLVIEGPSTGAPVSGDVQRLTQTFGALCRAVLREQPANGVVVVNRALSNGAASVIIAPEDAAATAADSPAADFDDKRGGMGLALPIARRVIQRHGGRIWSPATASGEPASRAAILVTLPLRTGA